MAVFRYCSIFQISWAGVLVSHGTTTYSLGSIGFDNLAGVSFPLAPFFFFFFLLPPAVGSCTGIGLCVGGLSLKNSWLSGRKKLSDSARGIHEGRLNGKRR